MLVSGFLYAQSNENYKSRNHKLSKYGKNAEEKKQHVAISTKKVEADVNDYMARNAKFHKGDSHKDLFIQKDKIQNDYRALNNKLNKNMHNWDEGDTKVPQGFSTHK